MMDEINPMICLNLTKLKSLSTIHLVELCQKGDLKECGNKHVLMR